MAPTIAISKNLQSLADNSSGGFLPQLKVCYKTSKSFEKGTAKLGEFTINDLSIGKSFEAVALAYKIKCIAVTAKGEYADFFTPPINCKCIFRKSK